MSDENRPSADDATLAFGAAPSHSDLDIPGHRVIRPLGQGGMGTVYLAEDVNLGRRVAVKIVSQAVAREEAVRARFLREARLLATIEHPNVVRVYSFGATDERAYLVMEYVEGETLADRIRRGPIAFNEAKEILRRVIDALDAAWEKKIVHRDIKPSNILFDSRGNLKVADFGLAKGVDGSDAKSDASLTQTGYLLGSPHYVAPEQAQGREADFRADIYSLGVTLFEMLTGRRPFEGNSALAIIARHLHDELPSLTSFRRDIGKDLADLVVWMTEKDPEKRPVSYRELLDAVNALDVADVTEIQSAKRARRRDASQPARRLPLALSSLLLLATIVLFITFQWRATHVEIASGRDDRLVVAIAPFWGPDDDSLKEGRSMAALIQQQVVTRLHGDAKVIGIDETKNAMRDADSARALGEKLNATAVIWGQAFALKGEREIQPSLTLVPPKHEGIANLGAAVIGLTSEVRSLNAGLPTMPEAIRLQSQSANELEMRKSSAEVIGDLVTFVAAMHALSKNEPQRALDLLAQTRRTPDALYQKAVCFAQMRRDDDAARELNEALKLDPSHAQSLAMLADIDARASRFADAATHWRAAGATGKHFTTSDAALYNDVLYAKERYLTPKGSEETATMIAIDPTNDHVLDRWELPGPPRVFNVDDGGMTVRVDVGGPRAGELMTLHFVKDHFTGPPVPHTLVISRVRRMRPGWRLANNFSRELNFAGLKLPLAHFRYSPTDADPSLPKTLPDLKAALENAIAHDPTQPWHRLNLAYTLWELGDRAGANRSIDELFTTASANTPYYEFAWMIRQADPLGHHDWCERFYAEALKRRTAEPQPIVMTATIERMLCSPFVRRASFTAIVAPDPPRDHLWLVRSRELTGLSWDGDELASESWSHYFREHGDAADAKLEADVHEKTHALFGGERMSLAVEDLARATQIAIVISIAIMLAFVLWRRGAGAIARNERNALVILALLMIVVSAIRVFAAARSLLAPNVPVPLSDSLNHPVIVSTLDELLERRDSDDLRFIAAVSHHITGDLRRAAELYRSVPWEVANDNLNHLESGPANYPTIENYAHAFHASCPYVLAQTLRMPWSPRASLDPMDVAAYDASQALYLSLLLAAALLLFAIPSAKEQRAFPAITIALFTLMIAFAGFAIAAQREAATRAAKPVAGKYSSQWLETIVSAYPFPPDPKAEEAVLRAMRRSEAMHLFWSTVIAALLIAAASLALLVRERVRKRRETRRPLLNQPLEVKA